MKDKEQSERSLLSRFDVYLVLALFISALLLVFLRSPLSGSNECIVLLGSLTVKTVQLDRNQVFTIPEKPNVIFIVENGAIAFRESDCPDKVCVNTGFIKATGQSVACLPNELVLKIESKGGIGFDDADIVIQ